MDDSILLNIHTQYSEDSEHDSDSEYHSSEEDDIGLLSSNIGVLYNNKVDPSERLLDFTKSQEYQESRNKYFTPEITKHICLATDTTIGSIDLTTFGFSIDRVIGFKIVKAIGITGSINDGDAAAAQIYGQILTSYDIIIDEIPYIACIKNKDNKHIVDSIAYQSSTHIYYENKNMFNNIYFTPIKLPKLTITTTNFTLKHLTFEITTLASIR